MVFLKESFSKVYFEKKSVDDGKKPYKITQHAKSFKSTLGQFGSKEIVWNVIIVYEPCCGKTVIGDYDHAGPEVINLFSCSTQSVSCSTQSVAHKN